MTCRPFPVLETELLFLRQIEASDCDEVLFLRSDVEINKFIERPEHRKTKNKADAIKFIKQINEAFKINKSVSWGITLKNNPKLIGSICLWNFFEDSKIAEVGYDLNPDFQGKGIMSEALRSVVDYGLSELKFEKIEAFTHKKNESSKKLLETNGFKFMANRKDEEDASNLIFEIEKPIANGLNH
jgi:ribosomal-protein-alanine N-acetyltransferase